MLTFQKAASQYIAAHEAGWKNEKHRHQWRQTLETFAFPVVGDLPVAAIDTGHILQILEPHWLTQTETTSRLRGRLERILDWARVKGFRKGENPARWKGHLKHLLPEKAKVQKVEHHPAMPYSKIPEFLRALQKKEGVAAKALTFTILTAARSGETRLAPWHEFDLNAALWTVPGERMKAERPHRIPLSAPALDIINTMKGVSDGGPFVFLGRKARQP